MFSCLENNCCLQLTGKTMVQVAREWKRTSSLPGIVLGPKGGGGIVATTPTLEFGRANRGRSTAAIEEEAALGPSTALHLGPATKDPGELFQSFPEDNNNRNSDIPGVDEVVEPANKKKGRSRPSSWQRRKARRAAEAAHMAMELEPHGIAINNNTSSSRGHIQHNSVVPATQPISNVDASARDQQMTAPAPAPTNADGGGGGGKQNTNTNTNSYGHTQWPRYMPKPSEMIINRSPIFYCSTFPLKPGFTARRTIFLFSFFSFFFF